MYRVLTTIQAHLDNASESVLRQGALSNNPSAWKELLQEPGGVLIRLLCVEKHPDGGYSRTEKGKYFQTVLEWTLKTEDYYPN